MQPIDVKNAKESDSAGRRMVIDQELGGGVEVYFEDVSEDGKTMASCGAFRTERLIMEHELSGRMEAYRASKKLESEPMTAAEYMALFPKMHLQGK